MTLRAPAGLVETRATLAYAGATYRGIGHNESGVRQANRASRQLDVEGRSYFTHDSVAAIALMNQVRAKGLVSEGGRRRVNGKEMTAR